MKVFRVTGNLNNPNTKMIMANITPHIKMRAKVIVHLNQRFIEVLVRSWIIVRH